MQRSILNVAAGWSHEPTSSLFRLLDSLFSPGIQARLGSIPEHAEPKIQMQV